MSQVKVTADSGGGTVAWKAPATTTSNAAVVLTLPVDDGAANTWLKSNGSGVTSWAAPTATEIATSSGTASASTYLCGNNTWGTPSGGKILQIVQTVKTDTTSLSSTTTFTDITGMSVSITPSSSSSKVLVQFSANLSNLSNGHVDIRLLRDSTAICVGDASSSRGRVTVNKEAAAHGNGMEERSMTFLDSPSTTSATTYKLQWKTGGVDAVLNRSKDDNDDIHHPRGVSTITVWEVGA